ncbi:4507_t:CDS:2, partial [Scutellospora calospora]
MEHRLTEYQYVYQQLTNNTLVAKNFYSYFGYTSLSDGIDALRNLLESLRDDTKLATEVVHKNILNYLSKDVNNLGENENDEQKEAKSSTHPVEDYNNSNTQTKDFP